ncbi:RimK family alpha-L-glutamate ligase [Patescibacteria group bacterium]|nr:RimK family alpha-L-glutamate ligase [Patescibacteria group bacterium]
MKIHSLIYTSLEHPGPATKKDVELLSEAAKKLGHELEIISALDCQLKFTKKPEVLIKNKKPSGINVLLVRANFLTGSLDFHSGLIKQFELMGIPIINKHLPVLRAKNKQRSLQTLSRHNIPMPKTYIIRSPEYVDDVVKDIGSFPVIIKTIAGSHGLGVSIVESARGLKSLVSMIVNDRNAAPLIVQEYIRESKGKDIRVFILGKRIIGAMERIATKRGEFRSNFHLGGRVRVAEMSRKEKDVAFAAVEACGLEMAGVDILRTKTGPKVLEVNANPGLEGITLATGRDVAGEIIKYTVKKARRYQRRKENGSGKKRNKK